ncbi:ATP-binding protein [Burkholderia multivorans]|uniref:ATP-binding protein n=1 Tax=Burkholderia multivorans TaxID=87883 RepID=UPI000CFEF81C|nr:ATP-binding protein [Burkholderia multivorans]MBY4791648.1 ATP-binding protein [Burkholderia multivorans]PRE59515.1 hypothetical protein C6P86_23650 [Burkholderia multivorans]PRE77074.1 hypothetical protein C6Q00_27575 [Burkholderia multivorans]PRG17291.1 hypothetical protein C6T57_26270 [Burkholderia multivorans]
MSNTLSGGEPNLLELDALSEGAPSLLELDVLSDVIVWTPAIERLAQIVAKWVRLDTPGGVVFGKQRIGKSAACVYLAAVLHSVIGYPVATVMWGMPTTDSVSEREFIQERMRQSGCSAVTHRDMAVLRGRLYDHIEQLADSVCAKRVIVIVDEAQALARPHYGYLIHCFNELVHRQLRPFFLLVGQPELASASCDWNESKRHQIVGRFYVHQHQFKALAMSELDAVLTEFDKSSSPNTPCAAAMHLPTAYADGWRIAQVAPILRDALTLAKNQHNLAEDIYIPMQYLRSTILAFLYRVSQHRLDPREANTALLLRCLRDAGFLGVMTYYAEAAPTDVANEREGMP